MKGFRNVPAIMTLLAGFIVSVIMISQKYTLVNFLWILVAVMVVFYVAGVLIRFILVKTEEKKEEKEKENEEDNNITEESAVVEEGTQDEASNTATNNTK